MRPIPAGGARIPVKTAALPASALLLALLSLGCSATTRHRVLTFFFDGVPPPRAREAAAAPQAGAAPAAAAARPIGATEHGPYAARLCGACHESAATNALVAPKEELCFRCHRLRVEKKYVHGPLASGGCLVCHDPHASRYPRLLVSDSDSFCFHCHEAERVARIEGHAGLQGGCTQCHDAHASDERFLLK